MSGEPRDHCIVLFASMSSNMEHKANTNQLCQLFDTHRIEYELLDGADPGNRELRNHLFNLSGLRGQYPQVFLSDAPCKNVTTESNWKFIGGWPEIQRMNETNYELKEFDETFKNVKRLDKAATQATGVCRPDGAGPEAAYTPSTNSEQQQSSGTTRKNNQQEEDTSISFDEFENRRPAPGRSFEDWEQHSDEEGDPFWYNQHTGESSWYPPVGWEEYCKRTAA